MNSTNGKAPEVSFSQALIKGQAPDKGLYFPKDIPKLGSDELSSFADMQYHEVASTIVGKFLSDEMPQKDIEALAKDAYDFEVPIERVFGNNHLMRLDRGPTASFKDFAARMMARLMGYFIKKNQQKLLILTATSGDTGSAVANAFHGADNIEIVVLFPESEVTDMQRMQMTTLKGNVRSIAIDGKFDDCQGLVKQAFADLDLSDLGLSSANSINIGRLIPQSVYYFYAHSRLAKDNEKLIFSIPSGNFGDMMGGMIAWKMGLPVERFIIATNENNEFPLFMENNSYSPLVPSKACISNAMNVGHPSNLARLFHLFGGWMDETGSVRKMPDMSAMRQILWARSVSDQETRQAIKTAYDEYSTVLEPHGAVGWKALMDYRSLEGQDKQAVSLETADPAKFPQEIESVLGIQPPIPPSLKDLSNLDEEILTMSGDYSALKTYLMDI